jgi:uncharacterized protein
MKLAIFSDTHGNKEYVQLFLNKIKHKHIDMVLHLGDNYDDADPVIDEGYPLIRVPGTWTSFYMNKMIDNRRYEEFEGWRFFLTHTPTRHYNDLQEDEDPRLVIEERKADVFLHGHTHKPKAEMENGVLVINPGHMKEPFDRGYAPSFAVLELSKASIEVTIMYLLSDTLYKQFKR